MARQPPLWMQQNTYPAAADRAALAAVFADPGPNGMVRGMAVTVPMSSMRLNVAAGTAIVKAKNGTGVYVCSSDATETVNIDTAPPAGQIRRDWVTVQPRDAEYADTGNDWILAVIKGTPGPEASAGWPDYPPGRALICGVTVPGGAAYLPDTAAWDRRSPILAAGPEVQGGSAVVLTDSIGQADIRPPKPQRSGDIMFPIVSCGDGLVYLVTAVAAAASSELFRVSAVYNNVGQAGWFRVNWMLPPYDFDGA